MRNNAYWLIAITYSVELNMYIAFPVCGWVDKQSKATPKPKVGNRIGIESSVVIVLVGACLRVKEVQPKV